MYITIIELKKISLNYFKTIRYTLRIRQTYASHKFSLMKNSLHDTAHIFLKEKWGTGSQLLICGLMF